jgi:DNA segregation ATPase FtsK/SpoIIIE, S-DNA-T family
LIEKAAEEMEGRSLSLQGVARKYTASRETPMNVLVIDELAYLVSLTDKKLRERVDKALQAILVKGRAVGFVVVGALQDPRKETLGFRDLFPVRVALALPAGMVDLVLGPDVREAGAYCDLIPMGEAGAGTAYVLSEKDSKPVCVRAFWCDDRVIREYGADVARSLETIQQHEEVRRSAFSVVQPVLQ